MKTDYIKKIRRERILRYAPLILWIGIIFFASTDLASMAKTSRFIGPLLQFLFPNASEETLYLYNYYIRKLAHITEYSILGFWAFYAFSDTLYNFFQKNWFWLSLGLVILVASTDEIHQGFVPSRGASIYDVMLDTLGGLIMLLLILVYNKFRGRNHT